MAAFDGGEADSKTEAGTIGGFEGLSGVGFESGAGRLLSGGCIRRFDESKRAPDASNRLSLCHLGKLLFMRFLKRARRRSLFVVGALAGVSVFMSGALWNRTQAQESDSTTEIAPGLWLRSVQRQTPNGLVRFWLVKADPKAFELGMEIADKSNAQKKRSVRNLAVQSGATVAINGGFFAYGGAAVGAVKGNGVWQRLPWKSRTALGWNSARDAQLSPLSGNCQLSIRTADGKIRIQEAALNGFTLPGQRVAIVDGFAVLTSQFDRKYTLKAGEVAFAAGQLPLQSGDVDLTKGAFWVVAKGTALQSLDLNAPPVFSYTVTTAPNWGRYRTVLGAGPRLLQNGQIKTTEVEEEFRPDVLARGPRTCVGWDAKHNWLLLVADGRSAASVGLSIPETAQLLQQLGATEALNLDGGSSTQLVVNNELVNTPSGFDPVNPTRPREVQVSNALVLKPVGL
ncbi:phosphodiester glycosidase family protein [bacterium]|nr:MAG: phosphodiester glycosidase family protein [bacterium]